MIEINTKMKNNILNSKYFVIILILFLFGCGYSGVFDPEL